MSKVCSSLRLKIDRQGNRFTAIRNLMISEPMSKANAIVNQKGHQCTSLCINYNVSPDDLEKIRQTPLLLRPYIFGFRRL